MGIGGARNMIGHGGCVFAPRGDLVYLGESQTTGGGCVRTVCGLTPATSDTDYTITDLNKEEYLNASQSKVSAKGKAPDAAAPKRDLS